MADLGSMIIETEKVEEPSPEVTGPVPDKVAEKNLEADDKHLEMENAKPEKRIEDPVAQAETISLPIPAIKVEKEDKASPETKRPEESSPELIAPIAGMVAGKNLEADDKTLDMENTKTVKNIDEPIAQVDPISLPPHQSRVSPKTKARSSTSTKLVLQS